MHKNTAGSSNNNNYDLLIIPQTKDVIPASRLTPTQARNATQSWADYGNNSKHTFEQTWRVTIAHLTPNGLHATTTLTIPQSLPQAI